MTGESIVDRIALATCAKHYAVEKLTVMSTNYKMKDFPDLEASLWGKFESEIKKAGAWNVDFYYDLTFTAEKSRLNNILKVIRKWMAELKDYQREEY